MKTIPLSTTLILGMVAAASVNVRAGQSTNQPVRMVIVGDSTVCDYPTNNPARGWGMFIQNYFGDGLKVINLARAGRSTKTFITEGLWARALKEKPDYVLIQFGHNDSHDPSLPESTDANTAYKEYLRQYIDDSRTTGAKPVLVTPMCRRIFAADGKLDDALLPYANAMKEVAAEKKVPLVDLHTTSAKLFEQLGPDGSKRLADKPGDQTHFNGKGAAAMAELVMKELPTAEPSLKQHLK